MKMQNLYNIVPDVDETPSRLHTIGTAFENDPESISNDDAFELLADLLGVSDIDLAEQIQGREFTVDDKK